MKSRAILATIVALAMLTVQASAAQYYADGSKINLATIRGAIATSCHDSEASRGGPRAPLHGGYEWESRMGPLQGGETSEFWQVALPDVYKFSNYTIQFYSYPYQTRDFTIQTSLDGSSWAVQSTVSGNTTGVVTGSFSAVDTKYIRVVGTAFQDNSYGMILQQVRFTGPNNPEINPNISLTQSTWNGGVASGSTWGDVGQANDDGTVSNWLYGTSSSATPGPLTITLNDLYSVKTIGLLNFDKNDGRAVKDMNVYISPSASGNTDWVLAKSITNIPTADGYGNLLYQEYDLDSIFMARRIRYDVLSNYGGGQTYIGEVYAYYGVAPVPEPATLAVVALGAFGLVLRRKA